MLIENFRLSLIYLVGELLFKELRMGGVSPRFHLVVFMFGVKQETYETGGALLGRFTFRILSNINDGAAL